MTQLPAAMSPQELDRLPRAVADFPLIRARGQIYADKTNLIHQLAATRDKYFLSRPRRFGKSLLLSTFEALFHDGLRDFDGLKIEELWHERRTWPVLRLDFSLASVFASREEFLGAAENMVLDQAVTRAGLMLPPPDMAMTMPFTGLAACSPPPPPTHWCCSSMSMMHPSTAAWSGPSSSLRCVTCCVTSTCR